VLRHTGQLIWVKRGQPTPPHIITHLTPHVSIWGVVWDEHRVFSQYTGHLNSTGVLDLLQANLEPYAPLLPGSTLILDGASVQWTQECKEWYEAAGFDALKLPPHSPRFNAIERCWAWIKKRVKRQLPTTQAELAAAMTVACNAMPQHIILAYINETRNNIRNYNPPHT
jgi:transposase